MRWVGGSQSFISHALKQSASYLRDAAFKDFCLNQFCICINRCVISSSFQNIIRVDSKCPLLLVQSKFQASLPIPTQSGAIELPTNCFFPGLFDPRVITYCGAPLEWLPSFSLQESLSSFKMQSPSLRLDIVGSFFPCFPIKTTCIDLYQSPCFNCCVNNYFHSCHLSLKEYPIISVLTHSQLPEQGMVHGLY